MRVHVRHQQREVRGSTIFAVLMNWNFLFSIFVFIPAIWYNFIKKAQHETNPLSQVSSIWYGSVLVLWNACEIPRLYLGITGNKDNLIAPLLLFGVVTFFIHLGVMIVFNFVTPQGNPMDKGLTSVQILFGVCELLLCLLISPKMVHQNTVDYYAHVWGQEKYNQSMFSNNRNNRKKMSGAGGNNNNGFYDDDDDDDDFSDHDYYNNNENNYRSDADDSFSHNNNNDQSLVKAPVNANAPQRVSHHQKGNLDLIINPLDKKNTPIKKKNRHHHHQNPNKNFSDSEMDSMSSSSTSSDDSDEDVRYDENGRKLPPASQCLASERNADRDYTPARGSRELLALAPPPVSSSMNDLLSHTRKDSFNNNSKDNVSSRHQQQRSRLQHQQQDTSEVMNNTNNRGESPSRLLRSPSARQALTVNTLRDSAAFDTNANTVNNNSRALFTNDDMTVGTENNNNTDKKKKKKSKKSAKNELEGGIAPPFSSSAADVDDTVTGTEKKSKKKKSSSKKKSNQLPDEL